MRTPHPRRYRVKTSLISLLVLGLFALASGALWFFDRPAEAAGAQPPQAGKKAVQETKPAPAASAALERLRRVSGAEIKTHVARETGHYDFVRAAGGGVLAAADGASAEERAASFLREHGGLVGLSDAERQALGGPSGSLRTLRVVEDAVGGQHVRLAQTYRGLPVFGAQVVVHLSERGVTAVNGHFVPGLKLETRPALKQEAAEAAAVREQFGNAPLSVVKTELGVYRVGLLEGFEGLNVLAYNVEVTDGGATRAQVWVDATKGTILNRISLNHKALDRVIYTPIYNEATAVRREGDPYTPGAEPGTTGADPINNLYLFAGETYNLWKSGFGRDSYDGAGHTMHSVYLVNQICPNAYWNSVSTNYCPDFDADDVVSHEWGHAYTEYTHGLIYAYQSGALNESYSDIFGESHDLLNTTDAEGGNNNAQPLPDGQRWQMGEDVPTLNAEALGILRDMWDPTRYGDPDKVSSPNYACGSGDGGGVHTNSGVPNHAFAMLVDGKTYNGVTVQGVGFDRALAIYYRAMTVYQTPTTNFVQHADALEASCADLIGSTPNKVLTGSPVGTSSGAVIDAFVCQQVSQAMLAVEMRDPVPCAFSPVLDPDAPQECLGSSVIFSEDWETGDDGWTRASAGTFPEWEDASRPVRDFRLASTLPAGRTGTAAMAKAPAVGETGGGDCTPVAGQDYSGQFSITSPDIAIPAGADGVKLSFDHYVATEGGVDGGQLEVSVNGGQFQLVPDSAYVYNAPHTAYSQPPPVGNNTNPNPGEAAWTGTNINSAPGAPPGSWGTTIVDLSALAGPGSTVKVRFNWSQDGCNGVDGWYVDNVRVYSCPVLEAPALALGADYQDPDPNGSYTLTWTRPAGATGPDVVQESSVCGPLMSDDAESGLGQWTAASSDIVAPMWQTSNVKPGHGSTAIWANPVSEQETQNTSATLTFNNPVQIPATGITTLNFSEWFFNEEDDHGYVEVSQDNGATWTPVYDNNRNGLTDAGALALAQEGLKAKQVDLTMYSGQTVRLRLRFALGQSNFFLNTQYGWYVDDISITNDSFSTLASTGGTSHTVTGRANGTRCYRVRTTFTFGSQQVPGPYSNLVSARVERNDPQVTTEVLEDDDARIGYSNGWHLVESANASAGHFRVGSGKDSSASLTFTVPAGQTGKVTYYYGKSTKGGTGEVTLDNANKKTADYRGGTGKINDPQFSETFKVEYTNIPAGSHTLAVRAPSDAAYLDRIVLESSTSNAQPAAGPGQTSTGTSTLAPGTQSLLSLSLPQGTQALSVVAASSPALPVQLVLISPTGVTLSTANSTSGVAVLNRAVTQPGLYTVRVVNVGIGPVQVWTAATPYVTR